MSPRRRPGPRLTPMPMQQILRLPRLTGHTSLDHLIGGAEQRFRDDEAESLGSILASLTAAPAPLSDQVAAAPRPR
jgi:hypothetical protein